MDRQEVSQAHLYVLNNTVEVIPYAVAHKQNVTDSHLKMNMMRVLQEHNRTFINWFRKRILADDSASKTLRLLALGPISMSPLGRDMISTTIPSTQSHRMIKVSCKIVGLALMLIRMTLAVHHITTRFKHPCLILE